jgi:hypothetical protein
MWSFSFAAAVALTVLIVFSCVPPRATPRDAGAEASDGGTPIVFSVGITDNDGPVHQVAPIVQLVFENGTVGPHTVLSRRAQAPPKLDGLDNDWSTIAGSVIPLASGAASIGMTLDEWNSGFGLLPRDGGLRPYDLGIDSVMVKSAYDDDSIYFLLQWSDSSKNDAKGRWTFVDGGWIRSAEDEDRLFLSFDIGFPAHRELGCAAACHLRERLDDLTDAGVQWRNRMHTNSRGERAELWVWGAASTNPMGHADDEFWSEQDKVPDDGGGFYTSNRNTVDGGYAPKFMSEDGVNAFQERDLATRSPMLFAADAGLRPAVVPFDSAGATAGAVLPGYVFQNGSGSRADVRAVGLWRNGKWTVELARARVTDDPNDTQFNIP